MQILQFNPRKETPNERIFRTYQNLRVALCVLGALLPFLVMGADYLDLKRLAPRGSISAYYHSPHSLTRDIFVGELFVIGIFLFLYRGYSTRENLVLDVGGLMLLGVAIFPTTPQAMPATLTFIERIAYHNFPVAGVNLTIHGICAIGFFLAIAYVATFRSKDSLEKGNPLTPMLTKIYCALGALMIIAPVGAFIFATWTTIGIGIFLSETAGILVFAVYWAVKTWEFFGTNGAVEERLFES